MGSERKQNDGLSVQPGSSDEGGGETSLSKKAEDAVTPYVVEAHPVGSTRNWVRIAAGLALTVLEMFMKREPVRRSGGRGLGRRRLRRRRRNRRV